MKPLYTQAEFDAANSRDSLPLQCEHCGNPFLRVKNDIQTGLRETREGKPKNRNSCCSLKCSSLFKHNLSVEATCEQCGKPVKKIQSQAKKTKHNFCSQSCAAKYHNAHKTTGTRVSKLERWLQEQLPLLFPGLEFHFNRTDAINAELDIYVPSIRLAFELNGIFHYEPIYGPEKLGRIQNNDERKVLACAEHGIGLCIVDISSVSYFKPTKAQKFLDIVANLIRTKLSGDLPAASPLPGQNRVEVP
jgi:hypothetical protein